MFSSLRARLWFSYAFLLLSALFLTALILVIYLWRSPLVYRQVYARMEAIQGVLLTTHPEFSSLPVDQQLEALISTDETFNVRLLVISSELTLTADSPAEFAASLIGIRRIPGQKSTISLRDDKGVLWLVYVSKLEDGSYLLIATRRPRVAILTLLRTDILPPFLVSGLAGLLLSLLVAFGLARWIGNPIQKLVRATQNMPGKGPGPLPLSGPRELQELTRSINTMNARVLASQTSQRELVANVSHELKTPLTSIQGFAQSLQDGTASTPAARQHAVGIIQEETERMHRMVLDLLDLARLDAGTLDLQQGAVDCNALLQGIVERFKHQAEAAGVRLQIDTQGVPIITGDGDRLAQVFSNLVDNAIKFTPSSGSVWVKLIRSSLTNGVQVEICDTGAGIAEDALPHIFERFYQVDPSRPGGERHGSGLGLAIVNEIIAAHGGTIIAHSILGNGSTFTITLPGSPPATSGK